MVRIIRCLKGKGKIVIKLILFGKIRYFITPIKIQAHSGGLVNYIWTFEKHYFSGSCKMTFPAIIDTLLY